MRLLDPHSLDQLTPLVRPRHLTIDPESLQRIRLLGDKDRLIMELTLQNGATRRQLATALNVAPGNISRRLRAISQRLGDPLVKALTSPACTLPAKHRQLGIEHFLRRRSLKQLMSGHELTYGQVKRMLEYIRGWHNGLSSAARMLSEQRRP